MEGSRLRGSFSNSSTIHNNSLKIISLKRDNAFGPMQAFNEA
jgi:hypothetical protein